MFYPSSATTTCGMFLFTSLLQHRCLPDHCKVGKEKSLLKTTQSFVAESTFLWFKGLRPVHRASGSAGTRETVTAHIWTASSFSQATYNRFGTVTVPQYPLQGWHPPTSSSSCDLHPAQAPLLWPLSPHTFHLSCSHIVKSPDVSQKESDYFSE